MLPVSGGGFRPATIVATIAILTSQTLTRDQVVDRPAVAQLREPRGCARARENARSLHSSVQPTRIAGLERNASLRPRCHTRVL